MTANLFPSSSITNPPASIPVTEELSTPVEVSITPSEPSEELLTPDQAATYLKIAKGTLGVWRSTKKGPIYQKTGNRRGAIILYKKADLDNFKTNTKIKIRKDKLTTDASVS